MEKINKKGISLIVLIVTVIVIIILAAVVILTLQKNNPINSAKEATFKEDMYNFKTELEVYKAKISKNGEDVTKLYASKDSDPSIKDVITSITRKYINKIEVREGKLAYVGKDKTEYILAKDMGLLPEDELLDDDILTELKPFVTEWTVEAGDSITLPIGGTCNFTVDYGDGTGEYKVTSNTDEDRIHRYENAGTYTISIEGKCTAFSTMNNQDSKDKLTKIVQWGNTGFTSFDFRGCKNLRGNIPEPTLNSFVNMTGFYYTFMDCSSLSGEIPEKLFSNCPKNKDGFYMTFYNCSSLSGSIPYNLFEKCNDIKYMQKVFYNCSSLSGNIPEDLFCNCAEITNFYEVFYGCKNLTGNIPEKLFSNCKKVTEFSFIFANCYNLDGSIPEKLFNNCVNAVNFQSSFQECKKLTGSIPQNLFKNNIKAKNFAVTFARLHWTYRKYTRRFI